jgi:hypothetical protein|nr:MAG TPA: hypothetical protein [Caudoviricetes sp.]
MPDIVPIEPTRPTEVSLPGNTDKAKEGASPEKKVVAKAKVQKKSAVKEALRTFFAQDLPEIAEHLVIDVAIPAAKNAITDMVTQGIQQLLYGEVDPRRRSTSGYTSYSSASRSDRGRGYHESRQPKPTNVEDLVFDTRGDAVDVIEFIAESIEQYGQVSVADLMSSVGIQPRYTDERWGWTTTDAFEIRQIREGWLVSAGRPEPLK